jgi:hypothetical protein
MKLMPDLVCVVFEAIHPAVPHTVAELFLLAPKDVIREVGVLRYVEGLADNILLEAGMDAVRPVVEITLWKQVTDTSLAWCTGRSGVRLRGKP